MGIPTNVVDAAAAIKDGSLGLIDEVSIGDLVVSALQGLRGGDEKEITERPVEAGFSVIEAAVERPTVRVLDIVLTNPDFSVEAGITAALNGSIEQFTETWRDKKEKLYTMYNGSELVTVTTHENVYPGMLIQRIEPWYDVDENWDCFIATVTFQQFDERQTESIDSLAGALTAGIKSVGGL